MEAQDKPTPKRRSRRKPSQPEAPRTSKEVEHPPTEKPVLKVETPEPNKYASKTQGWYTQAWTFNQLCRISWTW